MSSTENQQRFINLVQSKLSESEIRWLHQKTTVLSDLNNFKKSFKDDDDVQVADVQVAEVQVAEVSSTTEVGTDTSKPAPELENQPSSNNEG